MSFKHGPGERVVGGRFFLDLDQAGLDRLLAEVPALALMEVWRSPDRRGGAALPRRWFIDDAVTAAVQHSHLRGQFRERAFDDGYVRNNILNPQRPCAAAEALTDHITSGTSLWRPALEFALQHNHPVYDTLFIALAQRV